MLLEKMSQKEKRHIRWSRSDREQINWATRVVVSEVGLWVKMVTNSRIKGREPETVDYELLLNLRSEEMKPVVLLICRRKLERDLQDFLSVLKVVIILSVRNN